jgi:Transglycosylase SLT domain
MPAGSMALYGASESPSGAFAGRSAECLTLRQTRAPEGESFSSAAGRSLIVCTVLAGAIAGMIIALGGQSDPVQPAPAATTASLSMPKPRLNVAPTAVARAEIDALIAQWREITQWRNDPAQPETLVPDVLARGSGHPDDILQFGPMRIRRHLVETIVKAAQVTEADPVLLMAIADKESSFSTGVRAKTSSATGLFQFIDSTWLRVVRDFGARHGLKKEARSIVWVDDELVVTDPAERARILELRREPYISALLAAEMLKRDAGRIARRIGRDLTHGETYLAHFLGPDDAERFMEKVVDEPNSNAAKLLPKPARANKPIFFGNSGRKGLSIAEVHQKFQSMMNLRLDRYRDVLSHVGGSPVYAEAGPR